MIGDDRKKSLISYRLELADEALTSAKVLAERNLLRGSANRAYYALFYAASALLASEDLRSRSHSGVLSLIGKHFVKTGKLSKLSAKSLYVAFELRQKSDYEDFTVFSKQQIEELIKDAEKCLEEIKRILKDRGLDDEKER